jgi:hypothetical protein
MQIHMSSCYVSPSNHATHLKTSKINGGTKSLDTAKVLPSSLILIIGVKLVLVALKCDLRDDERTKERLAKYGEKCISYEEGLSMAKQIKAVRYLGTPRNEKLMVECSAKHNRGVLEAFTEASRVSLTARPVGGDARAEEKKTKKSCVIL